MNDQARRVTREELYEVVWSKPTVDVAKELGISDVAVAKICRKLLVPKPGLGYWAKVGAGALANRLGLPPLTAGEQPYADINPRLKGSARRLPNGGVRGAGASCKGCVIPDSLDGAHREILDVKEIVGKSRSGYRYYHHRFGDRPVLPLSVSNESADRALRLVEALIRGLEQRGIGLVRHRGSSELGFGSGKDTLSFSLAERSPGRRAACAAGASRLVIQVDEHGLDKAERSWSDGKRQKLEDRLGEVVQWIEAGVQSVKAQRLDYEERENREAAKAAKEQEARRVELLEARHRETLVKEAALWDQTTKLRGFIEACENELRRRNPGMSPEGAEMKWLAWAREHVDRLDPLKLGYLDGEVKRFGP